MEREKEREEGRLREYGTIRAGARIFDFEILLCAVRMR